VLLPTGQILPLSDLAPAGPHPNPRLVMNADGQVLNMGRKVRLATPAQRRAIFARYTTCWIDGCPLPATMCQIDHAHNWSEGGPTDLNLLGPPSHDRSQRQRLFRGSSTPEIRGRQLVDCLQTLIHAPE
jgi:hypothetical protein